MPTDTKHHMPPKQKEPAYVSAAIEGQLIALRKVEEDLRRRIELMEAGRIEFIDLWLKISSDLIGDGHVVTTAQIAAWRMFKLLKGLA